MRKSILFVLCVCSVCTLKGWGTQETSLASEKKHAINFYGTLETWSNQGTELQVDNISIDNLYKQIPFYIKPTPPKKSEDKKTLNQSAQKAAQAAKDAALAAEKAAKACQKGECSAALDVAKAAQKAAKAATDSAQAVAQNIPLQTTKDSNQHILHEDPKTSLIEAKIDLLESSEITVPHPDKTWVYQKEKGYRKAEYIEVVITSKADRSTKMNYLIDNRKKIYCDRITPSGPEEMEGPFKAIKRLLVEGYKNRQEEKIEKAKDEERAIIQKLSAKKNKG